MEEKGAFVCMKAQRQVRLQYKMHAGEGSRGSLRKGLHALFHYLDFVMKFIETTEALWDL